MQIPAEIKRLLSQIRRLARELEVDSHYISDFTRLYRFYLEMEGAGDADLRPNRTEDVFEGRQSVPSGRLQARLDIAAATRNRYAQRPEYYLLLKSFYAAFILPLEEQVAIALSCQALDIDSVAFARGKILTQSDLAVFTADETQRTLVTMREAFRNLGSLLFPATFNLNDFTDASSDQAQN